MNAVAAQAPATPPENETACAAVQLTDGWECERCALAFDDGDVKPPCEQLTYTRLRAAAIAEAERLEESQRALISDADGSPPLRRFRHQGRLKRAMELRALARMVDVVKASAEKVKP